LATESAAQGFSLKGITMSQMKDHPFWPDGSGCSFCGREMKKSGGVWDTPEGHVFCCQHCAIDVLPKLIADSAHVGIYLHAQYLVPRILASFWQAVAARLASKK
jgi:hypothetical protein